MPDASRKTGVLYVVATPIGNLDDISYRAVEVLAKVDLIAAEDTRYSNRLLGRCSITTPVIAYHEHNEERQTAKLIKSLMSGESIALISDAGTPLISDPGFRLVQASHAKNIPVSPVPGCCAAIAALSVSGLAVDRFTFEGFLPNRAAARRRKLEILKSEMRTMIFYESTHRIVSSLQDMVRIFGSDRESTLAREITKQFETVKQGTLSELLKFVRDDANQTRGEFVIMVQGNDESANDGLDLQRVLHPLLAAMPLRQAVDLAASITGSPRNKIYQIALSTGKTDGSED